MAGRGEAALREGERAHGAEDRVHRVRLALVLGVRGGAVLTPAAAAHRCVAPVAAMARAARTGYPPGEHTPPGCEGVLRRGGDWERDLKAWIERWSAKASRL